MTPDPRTSARVAGNDTIGDGAGPGPAGISPVASPVAHLLDQRFDLSSLYQVRAVVAAHAADLGLSLRQANDIVIAVHELVSNSVRHGPGYGRLGLWGSPRELICEVADGGAVRPAGTVPVPAAASHPADDLPWPVVHGHGLWLVRQVADNLAVRRGDDGAIAVVRFTLRPPALAT